MEILFKVVTAILLSISLEIVLAKLAKDFAEKESKGDKQAIDSSVVCLNKRLSTIFITMSIVLSVVGLALVIFPQICDIIEFDYIVTLSIWWVMLLFDNIILVRLLVRVKYYETFFEYTNAFGYTKRYSYEQVVKIEYKGGNVVVYLKDTNITLFNAFSGLNKFVDILNKNSNKKSSWTFTCFIL